MDIATFRAEFPEFGSQANYPDSQVSLWLGVAAKRLNADRWAELYDHGLSLFTAHHLVLARRNRDAASLGGPPGGGVAAVSAEAVDRISVSYDPATAAETDGGHWNLTTYGLQFIALARLAGAGGVEVDGGG